jgi:phosphate transport system permease protein
VNAREHPFRPSAYELRKEAVMRWAHRVTLGVTLMLGAVVLLVFGILLWRAAPALSWDLLWENPSAQGKAGGLWAPFIGTVWLVTFSVALVSPIGVAAAIYLSEYAKPGPVTRLATIAVTSLAGVPSIVHALFGLGAFVLFARMGANLLSASCTLAIMNLPVLIAASQEALAAVPRSFREACWNLGASRWHMVWTVVLPNSWGGILTGIIFCVARAAGETAPILFTGAVFFRTISDDFPEKLAPYGPQDSFMALAMHLHVIATQISRMPPERTFATAVVLVGLVVCINGAAAAVRSRLRKNRKW